MYLDEAITIFEEYVEDYKVSLIPGAGPTEEEERLLYAMEMALDCMKKECYGEEAEE